MRWPGQWLSEGQTLSRGLCPVPHSLLVATCPWLVLSDPPASHSLQENSLGMDGAICIATALKGNHGLTYVK